MRYVDSISVRHPLTQLQGTLDVSGRRHIEDFMERARLLADGVTFHSELDDVLHYDFSELSEFSD